jgi:hypothetical protein
MDKICFASGSLLFSDSFTKQAGNQTENYWLNDARRRCYLEFMTLQTDNLRTKSTSSHKSVQCCSTAYYLAFPRTTKWGANREVLPLAAACLSIAVNEEHHVTKVHRFRSSLAIVHIRYTFSTKFSKFLLIVLVPINASAAKSVNRGRLDNSITFMEQYSTLIRRRHYRY